MHEKIEKHNALNHSNLFACAEENGGLFPTTKFFQDNKTEIFEMDAAHEAYEIFESMRIYTERFGRPYNYLKSVAFLNEQRE